MRMEMRGSKHLSIVFDDFPSKEVIIDRENRDIRARIGDDVVKIEYEGKDLTAILVNDEYVYKR